MKSFSPCWESLTELRETKTPYLSLLDDEDNSPKLSPADSRTFRSAIGILLYLSVDLLECQCSVRALSSYMMCPTVNAMTALRHLAKYLSGVRHQALLLRRTPGGLYVESYSGDQ